MRNWSKFATTTYSLKQNMNVGKCYYFITITHTDLKWKLNNIFEKKKSFSWKTRNHWLEIIIAGSKKEYSMKIIYEELTAFVSVEFALNPLCQKIVSHNDFSCGWSMPLDIIFHNDINVLVWHWWKLVWIGPNSTISHAVVQLEIPNMDAIFFRGN